MIRVDTSTIIDASVPEVWALIRDFNGHKDWHPAIAESQIEAGRAGDSIGAVRAFTLESGEALREELLALSDHTHSFSYRILTSDVPLLNYTAHVELREVTSSARTFWRWWSSFDTPPGMEAELEQVVREGVYHAGFDAIAKLLAA
ncbi:MAG: SRPBCC family protein [Pseudomonadota bacterium]